MKVKLFLRDRKLKLSLLFNDKLMRFVKIKVTVVIVVVFSLELENES